MILKIVIILQISHPVYAETNTESSKSEGDKLIETLKKQNIQNDPLKQEIDPTQLEKKYSTNPKLSSSSYDQNKQDQELEKLESESSARNIKNTLKMYSCRNLKSLEEISECRKKYIKSISKK